jgi:hypothetical protein
MLSLGTTQDRTNTNFGNIPEPKKEIRKVAPTHDDYIEQSKTDSLLKSFQGYAGQQYLQYPKKGRGAVNAQTKGLVELTRELTKFGTGYKGTKDKHSRLTFNSLREMAKRVSIISSIHTTRIQQLRPFCYPSHNEEAQGYMVKLKEKDKVPTAKEKKEMKEITDFIFYTGKKDFDGAEEREDRLPEVIEKLTREHLTIDQIAIEPQFNLKGDFVAYWVLDGAYIKKTMPDTGYEGNKKIKYIQELDGKTTAVYERDELFFYCHNPRADIRYYGYGYSAIEQSIDIVTGWLYSMMYNKEVFNSSALPKGFLSFDGEELDQSDLEDLQREWTSMFSGIKGLHKTPFFQYGAKWQNMAPSNRDMEWNIYTQFLSSLICANHGIDAAEMGLRLNQAQNVLNDNQEAKIAFSKDRGFKDLIFFHRSWINRILEYNKEWSEKYQVVFTGLENKDQAAELDLDIKKVQYFQTINETRKERDLPPIENGDLILNQQYLQYIQGKEAQEQQSEEVQGEGDENAVEGGSEGSEMNEFSGFSQDDIEGALNDNNFVKKSFDDSDIIEIDLI